MAFVINTTEEVQSFKAAGNWFTFQPKKIKHIYDHIAKFIAENRKESGVMTLPDEFEDPTFQNTPEGKAILEKTIEEGIAHYVKGLRELIYNNQVSLRMDLAKADMKIDPAVLASEGELNAMRLVAKYQDRKKDEEQARIDEINKLVSKTGTGE